MPLNATSKLEIVEVLLFCVTFGNVPDKYVSLLTSVLAPIALLRADMPSESDGSESSALLNMAR